MLVQIQPLKKTRRGKRQAISQMSLRVTGDPEFDPARRVEQQRLDRVRMAAAVEVLRQTPDTTLAMTWQFDPDRTTHKSILQYQVSTTSAQSKRSRRLSLQLGAALSDRFDAMIERRDEEQDTQDRQQHTFAIVSTYEESCFQPVQGHWSNGQPLVVRDTIDWPLIYRMMSQSKHPVKFNAQLQPPTQNFWGQLDDARRLCELQKRIERHDEREHLTTRASLTDSSETRRQIPQAATVNSATHWPTPGLKSLAEIVSNAPVHIEWTVSSQDRETAYAIAMACQEAAFETGTAQVVETSSTHHLVPPVPPEPPEPPEHSEALDSPETPSSADPDSLLTKARTVLDAKCAARVLTWPRLDSPYLSPESTTSKGTEEDDTFLLGHRYDELVCKPTDVPATMSWASLKQHCLITGKSGYGKTAAITQIIAQAARADPPIPVVYISFAKDEGSALLNWSKSKDPRLRAFAKSLVVCGPHPEAAMPIRMNPFALSGADPLARADHAARVVAAAITLEGPLQANLQEACSDLCYASVNASTMPIIADLGDAVRRIQIEKGYSADVQRDIGGAFESRLGQLTDGLNGAMFRTQEPSPTIEACFERSHYLALGRTDIQVAAMFVVDFLRRLERYLIVNNEERDDDRPRLILIFDEIQELTPRNPKPSADNRGLASAEAAQLISRSVKVLRALDVSVVLASQHPGSIDEELVKAPANQIAFAQTQTAEREELGGLMGLSPSQVDQFNGLPIGEAFCRRAGMTHPQRIVFPFEPGIHDHKPLKDPAVAACCAQSKHARALTIARCNDELTLREARLLPMLRRLRDSSRSNRTLSRAKRRAQSETQQVDTARKLLDEIAGAQTAIHHGIQRRHDPFNRQWIQTLVPIPTWLTGWALTAKQHAAQHRAVQKLCRRHDRLTRIYRRLCARVEALRPTISS